MITKQDIAAALQAYWQEGYGGVRPQTHPAVRALLDKAEMADATRDRALAASAISASTDLLDQVVAAIHRAVCDAENQSCVDAERLDAAGRAVLDLLGDMRAAPPGLREQMAGRTLRGGPFVEDTGMRPGVSDPVVAEALTVFADRLREIQADLDRTKVRIAFADKAPDIRRVAFDRYGAEWRKIDESRWASLEHLGRYLTLADLGSSLGPLSDKPPPVKS